MASRETLRVGIREFRENLASFLLESDAPIVVTRHGDTVGYYIPARRSRSETERSALKEAAARLQTMLAAERIREDEVVQGFSRWRARKQR
ncbi:MAG: prevent-host-death protein [Candidatus Binatales bacterium]